MKKLLSCVLALAMVASMGAVAFADEIDTSDSPASVPVELTVSAATFSVTVPSVLPITVNSEGTITTADDVKIVNNSAGKVAVKNIVINGTNGWKLDDIFQDFKNKPVNDKTFGFSINGLNVWNNSEIASTFPVVEADSSVPFTYNASIAPQSEALSTTIANVIFTIGWCDTSNGLYNIVFTNENEIGTAIITYSGTDFTLTVTDAFFNLFIEEYGSKEDMIQMFRDEALVGNVYNSDFTNSTSLNCIKDVENLRFYFNYIKDGYYDFYYGPFGITLYISKANVSES